MKAGTKASIIISLVYVYTGLLALNLLLNPCEELAYTYFTLILALPVALPLITIMTLFKKERTRIVVGIISIGVIALLELAYVLFLLSTYSSRAIEFVESGLFQFVLLIIFISARVIVAGAILVFLVRLIGTTFEDRFVTKDRIK